MPGRGPVPPSKTGTVGRSPRSPVWASSRRRAESITSPSDTPCSRARCFAAASRASEIETVVRMMPRLSHHPHQRGRRSPRSGRRPHQVVGRPALPRRRGRVGVRLGGARRPHAADRRHGRHLPVGGHSELGGHPGTVERPELPHVKIEGAGLHGQVRDRLTEVVERGLRVLPVGVLDEAVAEVISVAVSKTVGLHRPANGGCNPTARCDTSPASPTVVGGCAPRPAGPPARSEITGGPSARAGAVTTAYRRDRAVSPATS